ncbi:MULTISPECIES: spore germination protein GerW family protein [unclassified Paraclostridium]|uniref:spore germination protein GerW family protein n=1 Tax=unclassified Paraclostridium TaxID=2635684 RepID=UPI0021DFA69E|nr:MULTISPECIES: spore germination protein GerW family protein [unclassified Paraclostridium]
MRSASSIKSIMDTTLDSIRTTIDANTIIGDPIRTETTVVVPISKVTIGFGIGGGEYSRGQCERQGEKKKYKTQMIQTLQEEVQVRYHFNQ